MSSILSAIDQRTQMVGSNRLELLTFRLHGDQVYAINVFKVQEVLTMPTLTRVPGRHRHVCGLAHLRGATVPVIDLAAAIGMPALDAGSGANLSLILTEYNSQTQGFVVNSVDRIINLNWEDVLQPPAASGREHYLTAITQKNDRIIEILDIEKVLSEILPPVTTHDYQTALKTDEELLQKARGQEILLVDDSDTAINQVRRLIEPLGIHLHVAKNGAEGLSLLQQWKDAGVDVPSKLLMVITDAEMPKMDGYSLTAAIRSDNALKGLDVVMHTSMSGEFNHAMVKKVGCDDFLSKFKPDALFELIAKRIRLSNSS